jgi:ABC-type uncharacterized transport system permease subunit
MDALLLTAAIAYAVAATVYYLAVAARRTLASDSLRAAKLALLAAVWLHFADVVVKSVGLHTCPVASVPFALSLTGVVTVGLFLAVDHRARIEPLGVLVAPLGLIFLLCAHVTNRGMLVRRPQLWLATHISFNIVGVGLIVLSAGVATTYLAQATRLKQKRVDALGQHLPGLAPLDSLMRRLLLIGFVPLSLGVTSGAAFANRLHFNSLDVIRTVLSYAAWLLVGTIISIGRWVGWRGRRIAWGSIAGAVASLVVLLMYLVPRNFTGAWK